MSEDVVLIEDHTTASGQTIKHVTLNAPGSLNALSIEMIRRLQPLVEAWDADDDVVCIFLEGAGEKAFCAGGDIVQIYRFMTGEENYRNADNYFLSEYCLDYTLHGLQTPLVTWADGITMGGGLGISVAGSHRVVTERTRMAMPEVTIGLYPDIGSTWFLSRMPGRAGLFLGLTGSHMNAGDALFTGLADRFLPSDSHDQVLNRLAEAKDWSDPDRAVGDALRAVASCHREQAPESRVRQHLDRINEILDAEDLVAMVAAIDGLKSEDDKWLSRAARTLESGCPVTVHLVHQQVRRGRYLSLSEAFQLELAITCRCVRDPDFREGVRALLIDKDGRPDWRYKRVADVPEEYIEAYFMPSWTGEHPMEDFLATHRRPLFG